MLKITDIMLEFKIDIDIFQFIEKGMRDGILYMPTDIQKRTINT